MAPDPAIGRVTEYIPTKLEKKKTKGVAENIVKIHNHRKIVGEPWQFLYETATKYIMYGEVKLLYDDMMDLGSHEIFMDYCVKHELSFSRLGIFEKRDENKKEG